MMRDRVTFEDESESTFNRSRPERPSSGLTTLMITSGAAKNAQQALIIQLVVSVLLLIVAIVLFAKKPNAERYGNYDEIKLEHPELFNE